MGAGKDKNAYVGWHFADDARLPEFVLQIHHDGKWHYSVTAVLPVSTARSLIAAAHREDFDLLLLQVLQFGHPEFYAELLKHPEMAVHFKQMCMAYTLVSSPFKAG